MWERAEPGLAGAGLTLQATFRGLFVHQTIGILPDRARELHRVPGGVLPLTGLAIGYPGDPAALPEKYRERDLAPRTRKPLSEFVFGGAWGAASGALVQAGRPGDLPGAAGVGGSDVHGESRTAQGLRSR